MSPPWLLLVCCVFSQCLLTSCFPAHDDMPVFGQVNQTGLTESSEYVFSPEVQYKNDKEIAQMLHVDSRGPEVAPFESEERRWNTPPPPDGPWAKAKKMVKKLFKLDKTTVKPAWNVTKELMGDYIIRRIGEMHRYIKYTVLNRPTPNATTPQEDITKDPLDFWRAHYTDWAFFNRLHHEIMNASVPEAHWWYRTLMAEAYGVNLDDVQTTTPMEFDIHRMDGFSTNVTLPTTLDMSESEVASSEFPDEVRAALTLRPAFNKAIDNYLSSLNFPTLPQIEILPGATNMVESPLYSKLKQKLMSFYYITTRSPDEWTDSYEAIKNRKLKKWLAKEEKRVLASVERHLDNYVPDFGPAFNAYYASIRKMSTKKVTSFVEQYSEEKTTKKDMFTHYEPPHVQKAFEEGREVNVTVLQRWLFEHCSNNTIEWHTTVPPTKPVAEEDGVTVTEQETRARATQSQGSTGSTLEIFTMPRHAHEQILHDNYTMDREKIDRMLLMASRHLKNLSLFKIEDNWQRVSKAVHEDQFTTTPAFDSQEVVDMFTHKLGNY